jgi:hypothetical protein
MGEQYGKKKSKGSGGGNDGRAVLIKPPLRKMEGEWRGK